VSQSHRTVTRTDVVYGFASSFVMFFEPLENLAIVGTKGAGKGSLAPDSLGLQRHND
jgi:hypothetical protein